jgi:hypothetical protein
MRGWGAGVLVASAVVAASGTAYSQTWVAGTRTPVLLDIVVVDHTGEPGWPYGFEDVFGDGKKFTVAEQALDIRTGYADTDAKRFWFRSYFSTVAPVGPDVDVYLFVDSDRNTQTGGSAAQKAINPAFTEDPTQGGYEVVLTIKGNGTLGPLWTWNQAQNKFVSSTIKKNEGVASVGVDLDPIRLNQLNHGFVQASVDFAVVGLTETCQAALFVRSVNTAGKSDSDISGAEACRPDDGNDDGIPDIIVPPECKKNADCPDFGVCIDGMCKLAEPCRVDTDCKGANMTCTADGRCVPKATGTCKTNDDCTDGLVCKMGTCTACDPGSDECGDGKTCLPSGTCLDVSTGSGGGGGAGGGATKLPPGLIRGGACTCTTAGSDEHDFFALFAWIPAVAWLSRRRRRRQEG